MRREKCLSHSQQSVGTQLGLQGVLEESYQWEKVKVLSFSMLAVLVRVYLRL